jgi:phosphatidylglycerophosphate synthase
MSMQAVLAIPDIETSGRDGEPRDVLMRRVAGVPLLERVLATAARAEVSSLLIIWPANVDTAILDSLAGSSHLGSIRLHTHIWPGAFDPHNPAHWAAIAVRLESTFLWLPWNWVTHKRALAALSPSSVPPAAWNAAVLLEKRLTGQKASYHISSPNEADGVSINSPADVRAAERFLVARSGKPTDGIYSNFNRRLCRPVVRLLSHTTISPNAITLGGLLVAIVGAFMFAGGFYAGYVAGALLFFVSGLFDEMDGMIARIKFRESAFGTWFEGFVDNATYLAVFSGIIVGLHKQYGPWALKYGIALIVGCVLSVAVIAVQRKLATRRGRPHEYAGRINQLLEADSSNLVSRVVRQIHIFVKKGVLVHYLLIFTVLGALPAFLWLAALGSNLTWILGLYFTHRFFHRPLIDTAGGQIQTQA